ncbi:DUF4173 domain-containing protein [Stieleria sp. JC731]|uniref:DUF4153 domain-containing protein n=1 Tax=Pirellulaceae TaxID=2691357 RepID=UPI001E38A22E|nr:DUF4153 domain-containing protein [Stieleria sp. JC731]MCC9600662.1 DUF4173 domain-containing protein [Stieleria sp. JC731]
MNEPNQSQPNSLPDDPIHTGSADTGSADESLLATDRKRMTMLVALAILAWTALADWLIYRSYGYSGPAAFFTAAPFLILLSHWRNSDAKGDANSVTLGNRKLILAILLLLILLGSLRLAFVGTGWVMISLLLLTMAYSLAASGCVPWAAETFMVFFWAPIDGLVWLFYHRLPKVGKAKEAATSPGATLAWLLPALATVTFATIFVLANPDLMGKVTSIWTAASDWAFGWFNRMDAWEPPFCVIALLVGAGLFFPYFAKWRIGGIDSAPVVKPSANSVLYVAFRNMLTCLIVLFVSYLVFEFQTLYKRDFPDGFYYAGYAHEGAAWLTVALALSTGMLSFVFRGEILNDPRINRLMKLAWIWSGLNFLLAASVYNRLMIYVGYNGLTQMRIVGFFGTSIVVAGFVLVLLKIAKRKGFWWLLRSQSTAFVLGLILLAIFPSDWVAHRYNSARVLDGYLHPSVMVAVKSKDEFGYLAILPLVDAEDQIIRDGVRAMLAERQIEIERKTASKQWHWTMFQWGTDLLYPRLIANESKLRTYLDDGDKRLKAINTFIYYSKRWY